MELLILSVLKLTSTPLCNPDILRYVNICRWNTSFISITDFISTITHCSTSKSIRSSVSNKCPSTTIGTGTCRSTFNPVSSKNIPMPLHIQTPKDLVQAHYMYRI